MLENAENTKIIFELGYTNESFKQYWALCLYKENILHDN